MALLGLKGHSCGTGKVAGSGNKFQGKGLGTQEVRSPIFPQYITTFQLIAELMPDSSILALGVDQPNRIRSSTTRRVEPQDFSGLR
jgi:hypothetical protein